MIKCKGAGCHTENCCIECPTKNTYCKCVVAEKLNNDKELILQKCKYAELVD